MHQSHVEVARIAQTCVHYGFCTAVCPTYVLLGDENDSPRGRIALAKKMVSEGGAPDANTVKHLDRCLSCLACTSTCAARVDYAHLIDAARAYIEQHFRRPLLDRSIRSFLAFVMPRPRLLKGLLKLAAHVRPLARLLPEKVATLLDVAPQVPRSRAPLTSPADGTAAAQNERRPRVAYHSSCVQRVVAPHIDEAAVRFLKRQGYEVVPLQSPCCGALALHMGKEAPALAAAERLVEECWREMTGRGLDAVVVSASGCGTTIKDYAQMCRSSGELSERAAAVARLARDVSEIVPPELLTPRDEVAGFKVAYHDACSLAHGQKVTRQPRHLLSQLGFLVADVPEGHFCCGSAGVYNLLQPELSQRLGARKAKHIESTHADFAAAGNLGCIHQLGRYLEGLRVVHTAELLDWGTGGPRPESLGGLAAPRVVESSSTSSKHPAHAAEKSEAELW